MIRSFIISFSLLLCLDGLAQSIEKKRIYINNLQVVMIKFPSVVTNFEFLNKDAEKEFETRITSNKNLSISSTVPNFKPTVLIVTEGNNSHQFLIEYKASLDFGTETVFDFSTKKKLIQEIKRLEAALAQNTPQPPKEVVPEKPEAPAPKSGGTSIPVATDGFEVLLAEANSAFDLRKYTESKKKYLRALELRPGDSFVKSRLTAVDQFIQRNVDDSLKSDVNSKYKIHTWKGEEARKRKDYAAASRELRAALELKPDDMFAKNQLENIAVLIKEQEYDKSMAEGKAALEAQKQDVAEKAFMNALVIKPNDLAAQAGMENVRKARASVQKSVLASEKNSLFRTRVSLADSMFAKGLYEGARSYYAQANGIRPGDAHVTKRISKIALLLREQKQQYHLDSMNLIKFQKEMDRGNFAIEKNDLATASLAFNNAKKFQPKNPLPGQMLDSVKQRRLSLKAAKDAQFADKKNLEVINKQYKLTISEGLAAFSKGDFIKAKESFSKARDLKPGERAPLMHLKRTDSLLSIMENQGRFNRFVYMGDSAAHIAMDYLSASRFYDSAKSINSSDYRLVQNIKTLNSVMQKVDSSRMKKEGYAQRNSKYHAGIPFFQKAEQAREQGRLDSAYQNYSLFLKQIDTQNLDSYLYAQLPAISSAKKYLVEFIDHKPQAVDRIDPKKVRKGRKPRKGS